MERYDLNSQTLISPFVVGTSLRAIDITPDSSSILVTERAAGAEEAIVRIVDTATGQKTNIFYPHQGEGEGSYDVAILNNNKAIFTADHQFSGGGTKVRMIDLATNEVSVRSNNGGGDDMMERRSNIFRGPDRSRVFMTGGNTSAGNVRVYDAASDSYLVNTDLFQSHVNPSASLSPDGSILAFEGENISLTWQHSEDLSLVETFPNYEGGVGFSPNGIFYAVDYEEDVCHVYETTTLIYLGQFDLGFDSTFNSSAEASIVFSPDSQTMVYQDADGIKIYDVSGYSPTTPESLAVFRGNQISGDVADVISSDNKYVKFTPGFTLNSSEPPVWLELSGQVSDESPIDLLFRIEASVSTPNLDQSIELFNFADGQYVTFDVQEASFNVDAIITVSVPNDIASYIEDGTLRVQSRLTWKQSGFVINYPWQVCLDQAVWRANN